MTEPTFTITSTFTDEEAIRQDERNRLSDLLTEHAELFVEYVADKESAVRLIATLLKLSAR